MNILPQKPKLNFIVITLVFCVSMISYNFLTSGNYTFNLNNKFTKNTSSQNLALDKNSSKDKLNKINSYNSLKNTPKKTPQSQIYASKKYQFSRGTKNNSTVKNLALIQNIMESKKSLFSTVLSNPSKYEVQILYTQIDRDSNNNPNFNSYSYNLDNKKYFYPASSIKLAACALSLERLNNLGIPNLNKDTSFEIGQVTENDLKAIKNGTSKNPLSIASCIKNILLASDNDSFNYLYDFLGRDYFNEALHKKGFKNLSILSKLDDSCGNLVSSRPLSFYNEKLTFHINANNKSAKSIKNPLAPIQKGNGYIKNNKLVSSPRDFSNSNYMCIEELQNILKSIMFPDSVPQQQRFNLTEDDYKFLRQYMSMYPRESKYPKFDLPNNYAKFFMIGSSNKPLPSNIKIYNKIGQAYGYLIDNAYIEDKVNNVEFLLTAVIYVNEDNIFNDDKYEYDTIGFPFFENIGQAIYEYELNGIKLK